jgi:cell division septation protein DedD
MILRWMMCFGLVVCIIFSGCGKKKTEETETALQSTPTSTEKDSSDEEMFKEFYEDSTQEAFESSDDFLDRSTKPEFNPEGRYVVQVLCALSQRFAESVASKLEDKGYPSYVAEVENPTPELQGTYYRIRIGGFDGVSLAKKFAEDYLVNDGYEYWVDNRSNDNIGFGGSGLGEASTSEYESYSSPEPTSYTQPEPAPQPVETKPVQEEPVETQPETPVIPEDTKISESDVTEELFKPEPAQPTTTEEETISEPAEDEIKSEPAEDGWGDEDWADDTTSW